MERDKVENYQFDIAKADMNSLINDYLLTLGLKDVVDSFTKESCDYYLNNSDSMIFERSNIIKLIKNGDIRGAASILNDFDATILRDTEAGYHLQKQALLEMFRRHGDETEILQFAQSQVAPLVKNDPKYLQEIEDVMIFLLYEDYSKAPHPHLLDDEQRCKTASIANEIVLRQLKRREHSHLESLIKMVLWAQTEATKNKLYIPIIKDILTASFS